MIITLQRKKKDEYYWIYIKNTNDACFICKIVFGVLMKLQGCIYPDQASFDMIN